MTTAAEIKHLQEHGLYSSTQEHCIFIGCLSDNYEGHRLSVLPVCGRRVHPFFRMVLRMVPENRSTGNEGLHEPPSFHWTAGGSQ